MKPFRHARRSARLYGGVPEDYQAIHDFMDQSKAAHADMRHRAILHNSLGPFIVEQAFGVTMRNSDGRDFSPRDVAEQHIIDDLGRIPSVSDYLNNMQMQPWMGVPVKRVRRWVE